MLFKQPVLMKENGLAGLIKKKAFVCLNVFIVEHFEHCTTPRVTQFLKDSQGPQGHYLWVTIFFFINYSQQSQNEDIVLHYQILMTWFGFS